MIFHLSIAADEPKKVAEVMAEIWGGVAVPFAPVGQDSWAAFARDDRNSMVEVYQRGSELHEAEGDADATCRITGTGRRTATHFATATALDRDAVFATAEREGWPAKYRKRGGHFGVIEMWIEGVQMIEVLTPEMQAEYLGMAA